jgi:PTH1 family peptidyl-tRNA hydrolase
MKTWGRKLGVRLTARRFHSHYSRAHYQGKAIVLLCPATFMNHSGRAVKACADFYHLNTENMCIIHDDLDLPVGRIKVVRQGGAGGHRGVASIIHSLGTVHVPRIKVGIGRPQYDEAIEDYVLAPFYSDEESKIGRVRQLAVRACELFVSEGIEPAMNRINCRNFADKEVS